MKAKRGKLKYKRENLLKGGQSGDLEKGKKDKEGKRFKKERKKAIRAEYFSSLKMCMCNP